MCLETNIIAYHPIVNCISNGQFKKQFCRLIEEANDNLFVDAEIQAINDETKFFDAMKKFDKITNLEVKLHPSNPSNRARWKKTDEKLHDMKIEKYTEIYVSKNGIIIPEGSETYGNILMAGDGYGEAKIIGLKNGKNQKISTKKMPIKKKVPKSINENIIIKSLIPYFKKILLRFKK